MRLLSLNTFLFVATGIYVVHSVWTLYSLWNPEQCNPGQHGFCLNSIIHQKPEMKWKLKLYSQTSRKFQAAEASLVKTWRNFNFSQTIVETLEIPLPESTLSNGSLYYHLFLHPHGESAFSSSSSIRRVISATKHAIPVTYFNLLQGKSSDDDEDVGDDMVPVTHWYPKLSTNVMNQPLSFAHNAFPAELVNLAQIDSSRNYLPLFYVDGFSRLDRHLRILPKESTNISIQFKYEPISAGKLRLWFICTQSMQLLKKAGLSDKDIDETKSIFTETNFYLLGLTFIVTIFHMLFDVLAFKNDIKYWKGRETMTGLSFNTVVYRCISSIIIFLYLYDSKTSLLVLAPAGIGSVIEVWKVKKALKLNISLEGWKIKFTCKSQTEAEKSTVSYDQQAFTYLSYALYPLCIAGAVYSLFYTPHKSMYSWIVQSLVNGVYVFGFLFMLPQLFINYKLKSVAHLPWRAFMYKAFNTFIDDVFAFIIEMPTSHRIACFRDDIIFFCYLYQLWLYPVDKSRPNEYGMSYEHEEEIKAKQE